MPRMRLRRRSSSEWNSTNPVLAQGEVGYDLDLKTLKVGDGTSPWSELEAHSSDPELITILDDRYATTDTLGEYLDTHAPEIAAAAAALAASDAGLVRKTDNGIPRDNTNALHLSDGSPLDQVTLDPSDKFIEGRSGAYKVVPGLRVGKYLTDDSTSLYGVSVGDVIGPSIALGQYTERVLDRTGNVPKWVLDRWKGRMGVGAGPLTPIDIWIVMGQSNSTRRSSILSKVVSNSDWILRWDPAVPSFVTEDSTPPWLGSGIARAWWERDAFAVGRRVATVEAGIGGTGFYPETVKVDGVAGLTSTWDHSNPTGAVVNLATRARDMALAALAAAPAGSRIMGVIWSQGEADRGHLDTASYSAAIDDLISWFRGQLTLPNLPWILSPFTPQLPILGSAGTAVITAALEDTPRRVEYTAFDLNVVDDSDQGEFIHWSPDAQHRRGYAQIIHPNTLYPSAWDQALLNTGRVVTGITTVGPENAPATPASNVIGGPPGTFLSSDVGRNIMGTSGILDGTRIAVVTSDILATMGAAATATGTTTAGIGSAYRTPPGLKITRSGNDVTITWGHPACRVTSFLLETTTAGADTGWTTQTLTSLTTHRHTMTVAAGTPLWVRIAAVGPTGTSYKSEVHG